MAGCGARVRSHDYEPALHTGDEGARRLVSLGWSGSRAVDRQQAGGLGETGGRRGRRDYLGRPGVSYCLAKGKEVEIEPQTVDSELLAEEHVVTMRSDRTQDECQLPHPRKSLIIIAALGGYGAARVTDCHRAAKSRHFLSGS